MKKLMFVLLIVLSFKVVEAQKIWIVNSMSSVSESCNKVYFTTDPKEADYHIIYTNHYLSSPEKYIWVVMNAQKNQRLSEQEADYTIMIVDKKEEADLVIFKCIYKEEIDKMDYFNFCSKKKYYLVECEKNY